VAAGKGRIESYTLPTGGVRYRIVIQHAGQRWRIGQARVGNGWRAFESLDQVKFFLGDIRAEFSRTADMKRAVAPYMQRPDDALLIPRVLARFLERQEAKAEAGDLSPRTPSEMRWMIGRGVFDRWRETHAFSITYGDLEDWSAELAAPRGDKRGLSAKSRQNVLGELRRALRWLHRRGEIEAVPDFPSVPRDRKAAEILTAAAQDRVLAAIAWERRGAFLAMAHTLRPGEARALDLLHWSGSDLLVQQAVKGQSASAPIRGLKERDWRVVEADAALAAWIEWRLSQASPAERLQRAGIPLFPAFQRANRRTDLPARWSHHGLWSEWRRACDRAGVARIGLYRGTKHTTATDLVRRGVDARTLQRFLGHADPRSTDAYVVLASDDVKGLVRRRV
jgi:integrase